MADVGKKVIGISLGLLLGGVMLPIGLGQLADNGTNYAGVDPAVVTICTIVLPIMGVVGIAYAFYAASD